MREVKGNNMSDDTILLSGEALKQAPDFCIVKRQRLVGL